MQDKTISKLIQKSRRIALAENLECLPENIIPSPHSDKIFSVGTREYHVGRAFFFCQAFRHYFSLACFWS